MKRLPSCTAAAALLLSVPLSLLPAQAPPGALPPEPAATTLLLVVDYDGDAARVLSAHPKDVPFVPTDPRGDERLRLTLRDRNGNALRAVEVAMPHFGTVCQHGQGGAGGAAHAHVHDTDEGAVFVRVPDLGDAVADVVLDRVEGRSVERLGITPGHVLRSAQPQGGVTVKTVRATGPTTNRLDLVILGEAYTAAEESVFDADVQALLADMFGRLEPFRTYGNYINVHSVFRASGSNDPCSGSLAYGARICQDNVFTLPSGTGLQNLLTDAAAGPDVDQGAVLVLVNTASVPQRYGGVALFDFYGIATTNRIPPTGAGQNFVFPNIAEHELGHALGFLHDEYDDQNPAQSTVYSGPEFAQANLTRFPSPLKWGHWQYPWAPQPGGNGFDFGVWHPEPNCQMNLLDPDLCRTCREEYVKRFYTIPGIDPLENVMPSAQSVTLTPLQTQTFSFNLMAPAGAQIRWYLDGVWQNSIPLGASIDITGAQLTFGTHTLEVRVEDNTLTDPNDPNSELVRSDPGDVLHFERSWTIQSIPPIEFLRLNYIQSTTYGPGWSYGGTLGTDLMGVGDIDGDGADDYAFAGQGYVYMVSGRTGLQLWRNQIGVNVPQTQRLGLLGDMNGDGRPELGIRLYTDELAILSGVDGAYMRTMSTTLASSSGLFPADMAGLSDLDADGYDEYLAAEASTASEVLLIDGSDDSVIAVYPGPFPTYDVRIEPLDGSTFAVVWRQASTARIDVYSTASTTPLATFTSVSGENFRSTGHEDLDGDGLAELIVADWGASNSAGIVRVFEFDAAAGTLTQLFSRAGGASQSYGSSVSGAGDFDMDGFRDVLVGAHGTYQTQWSGGSAGFVEVLSGRDGSSLFTRSAPVNGQLYGRYVANVGDVNDDGRDDYGVTQAGASVFVNGVGSISSVHVYSPEAPSLTADGDELSAGQGGTVTFTIDAPPSEAGRFYVLGGSASGTRPGTIFGQRRLPLNSDWYFDLVFTNANTPLFVNTLGVLDANGDATCSIAAPPGLIGFLVGLEVHHAVIVTPTDLPGATWTSNAVRMKIVN